jgi:tricorn protease
MIQPHEKHAPVPSFTHLTWDEGVEIGPTLAPDGQTFAYTRGADIYLQRVGGRNAINLTKRCELADSQPAFSPDGTMIAYRSECDGGGIFIMGATGESARRITAGCFNPSWSPDSARIVCGTEPVNFTPTSRGTMSSLWILDVKSGAKRRLLEHDGVQPSWSPHGHRIAYWGMAGESAQRDLWTIDPDAVDPSKTIVRVNDDPAVDWNPVWAPDGQALYFGSDRSGAMNLWRIAIDEESGRAGGEAEPVMTPARFSGNYSMSRDGSRMVYASIEQTEAVKAVAFDPVAGATSGEPRPVLAGSFLVFSSQVSPDGRYVGVTNRGGQEDLYIVEVATGEVRQLTNDAFRDRAPVWSPDAQRIYFYSNRDRDRYEIWSINPDGSGLTQITHTTGRSMWYPGVSADGKHLAFFNDENSYTLDISTAGAKIEPLPPPGGNLHPALSAWSPDSTMLAGELRDRPGIAVYSLAGRRYRAVTTSGARPIWLPSGQEILYSDAGKPRIVNITTGTIRDVTTALPATAMSLSADGKTLVYSDRRTESDIWLMERK